MALQNRTSPVSNSLCYTNFLFQSYAETERLVWPFYFYSVAKGRLALLTINLKDVTCAEDCNLEEVAKLTEGYSGADITNVCRYQS